MRRVLAIVAVLSAAVLSIIAVASVRWYVFDVAIGQAGEPDRSMVFWGLPILYIGLVAAVAAIGLGLAARNLFGRRP